MASGGAGQVQGAGGGEVRRGTAREGGPEEIDGDGVDLTTQTHALSFRCAMRPVPP